MSLSEAEPVERPDFRRSCVVHFDAPFSAMTEISDFQVVNRRRHRKAQFHHRARENAERTKTIAIRWDFSLLFVCEPSHSIALNGKNREADKIEQKTE